MLKSATQTVDEQHLRTWIGREESTSDILSSDLARKFSATFNQTGSFAQADVVPRLIHFCLAQPAALTDALGEDGHPTRGGFLPPVPLPQRMWAGGSVTFTGDLHVGDTVHRVSRIADVVLKAGRAGPLCFVAVEHIIDVDGRPLLKERQDLVYRSMVAETAGAAKVQMAAPSGTHRRSVTPSPPFLFRYSALTFNGHRIHYDKPYAIEVEGYPGLVVHGPLQATLLMNFATEIHGKPPARFTFRSQSPLFDGALFDLHADEDGAKLKLWTAGEGGPVAMAAEAEW